ncbi:MAG: S8 family peptidase [Solirubrobacterales bacterium]
MIEGRYIVVYNDTDNGVRAETTEREAELGFESRRRYTSAIDGFAARLAPSQVRELKRDPEVDFVSEDRRVEAVGYVPRAPGEPTPPTGVRRTLAATDTTVREASGINVAVIDTGIQLDHPDLNAADGIDCVDPGTPASDENGHGTHVTGTIAAKNDGAGVVGVAPGTKAYAVRVLGAFGHGTTSQVVCGIDWVTANASALEIRVANMSLGGRGPSLEPCETTTDAMHVAICNSTAAGVNYVVAAGNDGRDFDLMEPLVSPAAYPEVLTVTALSDVDGAPGGTGASASCSLDDDRPAGFSNYAVTAAGRAHTIAAPGACIRSTGMGSTYETNSGTSMASPHAAGMTALCIDEAGTDGACANLAPAEVIAEVRSQAQSYNETYPNYGFLRDPQHSPFLSAYYGFLAVAPGADPPPPSPPPPASPPNDDFADARDLGDGPSASADGTNVAATKEPGEPVHYGVSGGASVWYRWKAPYSGRYGVGPCANDKPLLGVYTGSSVGSLTRVAKEFSCDWRETNKVPFDATAGVTYRIAVDGFREPQWGLPAEGPFQLRLIALSPPPTSQPSQPSNQFSFGKVKANKRKGTAKLTVEVPGPGELELAKTKKVKGDEESVEAAGDEELSVRAKGKAKKSLSQRGDAKVKAKVTYTPTGGTPNTESEKIKLIKR